MPLSPYQAVLRGHLVVNLPVLLLIGLGGAAAYKSGGTDRLGTGILGGTILAWIWWSFAVPRWRRWANNRTNDPDAVQRLAQRTGLVWKRGSLFEKTEIR